MFDRSYTPSCYRWSKIYSEPTRDDVQLCLKAYIDEAYNALIEGVAGTKRLWDASIQSRQLHPYSVNDSSIYEIWKPAFSWR